MRIGLLVPHIFMQDAVLPQVIFAPAYLAMTLAEEIQNQGHEVTLFTPGTINTKISNITADLSYFEKELRLRGDTYIDLLRKHPFTFVTLARQVQSELIAQAMSMANNDQLDILHVYTNEEDTALPFAALCQKPIVFTHHDPMNFLVKYKSLFPKYPQCNWISISMSQRQQMPADTNWIANIYHGLPLIMYRPVYKNDSKYIAYLGRIINTKGVHLAIQALQKFNKQHNVQLKLKIAGKHYADHQKDMYWRQIIEPQIKADSNIEYVGYLKTTKQKQNFLGGAKALIVPSTFEEPFGMVMIEALACGTPIIGLDSGAIPEVINHNKNGYLVEKQTTVKGQLSNLKTVKLLAQAIESIEKIDRHDCRQDFEKHFTADRMAAEHVATYAKLLKHN